MHQRVLKSISFNLILSFIVSLNSRKKCLLKTLLLPSTVYLLVECNPACLDNNISKKLQNLTEFVNLQRLIRTRERKATTTKLGYNTIYNNNCI